MHKTLLDRITAFLNVEFNPQAVSFRVALMRSFLVGLTVFLALAVLQPFGTRPYPREAYLTLAGYGLVTMAVVLGFEWWVFPTARRMLGERWRIRDNILFTVAIFLTIATANFFYHNALYEFRDLSLRAFWEIFYRTMIIGVFPYSVIYMLSLRYRLQQSQRVAAELQARLEAPATATDPSAQHLQLKGQGKNEALEIAETALLFLNSADNYTAVNYLDAGTRQQKLLRATLSAMEAQLQGSAMHRCHRSYIVNLSRVVGIRPAANGYQLRIEGHDGPLPVSRKYQAEIRRLLSAHISR